jgi:hypothetical protein
MGEGSESRKTSGWQELRKLPAGAELAVLLDTRSLASLGIGELVDVAAAAKRLSTYYEAVGLAAADAVRCRFEAQAGGGADPDTGADRHVGGDLDDVGGGGLSRRASAVSLRKAKVELAAAIGETKHRVNSRLHLVRQLKRVLPQVWELVAAGRLDVYQAGEVIAEELAVVEDKTLLPAIEDKLVAELEQSVPADATRGDGVGLVGVNPTATRRFVRRLAAAAQPQVTEKRFQRGYAQRRVCTSAGETHGMGELWMSHSVDRIAGIGHRLGLLARALPADDPRSMEQRMADLAADILEGRVVADTPTSLLEDGAEPRLRAGAVRRRVQLNITVPIQTLFGLSEAPGETLTGEVVPAGLARTLAADPDSVWYRMLTDAGRFVELSTDSYTPTAAQARTVVARDRTCVGVGCTKPADACDLDHSRAHRGGGATREGNLGPACRGDHALKDNAGGCTLRQGRPGVFSWTYPSGHTYTTRATPYPQADWPALVAASESAQSPIPASAADITEGLALLQAKRQRDAAAEITRTRISVAEETVRFWRKWHGDDHETPDEDTIDYLGALEPSVREEFLSLVA